MTSKNKPTLLEEISTLCDNKSSVRARFALATFPDHSPSIILDKCTMFFEYIQLVSPILIMLSLLNLPSDNQLFQLTLFIARLINPSYWMSFDKTGALENMILILVCCFTLLKQMLFMYVLYRCSKSLAVSGTLRVLIETLMRFQTRITYFYVSSYYINAIKLVNWEHFINVKHQSRTVAIILCILIGLELMIALIPKILYHNMLPTKSFLSSKTNTLEVTTFVQKILVQILVFTLDYSRKENSWIFATVNLCIDLFRILYFFRKLPLYSFKSLHFQGSLLMVITSLDLSYFVSLTVKSIDDTSGGLAFSLVIWVLLALFGVAVSVVLLRKALLRVICDPNLDSPSLLVHRIVAIKELKRSMKEHYEKNEKYDFYFLINQTLNQHLGKILWIDESFTGYPWDINSKESANKMFKNYLEMLREKFLKDQFIQIFLAEFYFKTLKVSGDPIRICLSLRQNGHLKVRPNAEVLLFRIQGQIESRFKIENSKFDLVNYISEQAFVAMLKLEMIKQTRLQAQICSEIMKDSPNLGRIDADSQKAHLYRQNIQRKINRISAVLSDFNLEPLLLSAKYYLSVNHSVADYLHYIKLFSQKLNKYQKSFHQETLCVENSFEEKAGFLFISAAKGQEAKIIYATKSIESILGGDTSQYAGASFITKSPPIWRPIYAQSWKEVPESTENSYLGRISRCLMYHVDGYLVETDYYVNIHPFATQGFHLVFLLRTVVSNREFILVHENGDIDSVSKGLMLRLGLQANVRKMNLRALNAEFGRVNEAFNMMAFPEKYNEGLLRKEEAEEIYTRYSSNFGCEVLLNCLKTPGMSYSYNCKIQSVLLGTTLIKTITLEENKRENKERTQDILSPSHMKTVTQREITLKTEDEKVDSEGVIMLTKRSPFEVQSPHFTEREVLIGEEQDQEEPTTNLQQMSSRSPKKSLYFRMSTLKRLEYKNSTGLAHFSDSTNERQDSDGLSQRYEKGFQSSLINKNITKLTQQKKLSKAFHASLDARYYPKTFWGLFNIFYFTLFVMIFVRIALRMMLDNEITSLVAKKDIFKNNGYRSYQLIETSGHARFTYQVYSGVLNVADYGSTFNLTLDFVFSNIQNLRRINKVVLQTSNTLNGDTHLAVFEKNIKVYDTYFGEPVQSYAVMDSFQATDRVIETALYLYYVFLEMSMSSEMTRKAHFLFRNSLNDLIVENTKLSFAMVASFDEQLDYVKSIQFSCAMIFGSFLVIFTGIFFAFLGKQYSRDVFYTSSVCKLNHSKIQSLRIELGHFQKFLQGEKNSYLIPGDKYPVKHAKTRYQENSLPAVAESSNNQVKRESLKTPNHKDLRKTLLISIFGILLILIILIIFIILNQIQSSNLLQKMKENQERIFSGNTIRIYMAFATTSVRELFATNNTAFVSNTLVFDKLEQVVEQLKTLQTKTYSMYLNDDLLNENPKIKTLFLGDGCSLLDSDYDYYCAVLEANGMSSGLLYLVQQYERLTRGKMEAYVESNKTEEALAELQAKYDSLAAVIYLIGTEEADILVRMMDDQFEETVQIDHERRVNSMMTVFLLVFVIGFLGWRFILKKLAESVNSFKNILRSFPAELVLSSFILKMFLLKSSKGALEQVKNEI